MDRKKAEGNGEYGGTATGAHTSDIFNVIRTCILSGYEPSYYAFLARFLFSAHVDFNLSSDDYALFSDFHTEFYSCFYFQFGLQPEWNALAPAGTSALSKEKLNTKTLNYVI